MSSLRDYPGERQRLHLQLSLQHVGMKLCPANGAFWRGSSVARFDAEGKPAHARTSRIFNYLGARWGFRPSRISQIRDKSPSVGFPAGPSSLWNEAGL